MKILGLRYTGIIVTIDSWPLFYQIHCVGTPSNKWRKKGRGSGQYPWLPTWIFMTRNCTRPGNGRRNVKLLFYVIVRGGEGQIKQNEESRDDFWRSRVSAKGHSRQSCKHKSYGTQMQSRLNQMAPHGRLIAWADDMRRDGLLTQQYQESNAEDWRCAHACWHTQRFLEERGNHPSPGERKWHHPCYKNLAIAVNTLSTDSWQQSSEVASKMVCFCIMQIIPKAKHWVFPPGAAAAKIGWSCWCFKV